MDIRKWNWGNVNCWAVTIFSTIELFQKQLFPNADPVFLEGLMLACAYIIAFAFHRMGYSSRRRRILSAFMWAIVLAILTVQYFRQFW
jgi:hypothetical protein